MNALRSLSLQKLAADQRGLTTVEYVIALGLIAAVAVGSWQTFGSRIHKHLDNSSETIESAFK